VVKRGRNAPEKLGGKSGGGSKIEVGCGGLTKGKRVNVKIEEGTGKNEKQKQKKVPQRRGFLG